MVKKANSKLIRLGVMAVFLWICLGHVPAYADMRGLPSLTVLADTSLVEPVNELIRRYSRAHLITVSAQYESSGMLAQNIMDGSRADIFITAHPKWISMLKQQGLIDVYSLANLVQNRLVFVAGEQLIVKGGKSMVSSLSQWIDWQKKRTAYPFLVMGDDNMEALGIYSKEVLQASVDPLLLEGVLVLAANASEAKFLLQNNDYVSIMYLSDAKNSKGLVILEEIPSSLHEPIIYQMAVVAGEHMELARGLIDYMTSPEAMQLFQESGFSTFAR